MSKIKTGLKFAPAVGLVVDAANIGYGVYQDGGEFGQATSRAVGGAVGGWGCALAGAAIGGALGGPLGALIGGIAGGIIGGIGGEHLGGWFRGNFN